MRVVIIGGSGHIGTYLVPRLVADGHEVVNVSRGQREPYHPHGAWRKVRQVQMDRAELEQRGQFGERIRELRPDVVIDLICFTLESARQLAEALRGQVQHFLHCGTIWVHGPSVRVPATEDMPRRPFGEYGIQKAKIEAYLLEEARRGRLPATVLHPGHIVGPGWAPLNPAGHFNPEVFARLARGDEVALPNLGMETVHHVHADDVAQAFQQAIRHWSTSVGESFHVVSPAAVTLRGYAEAVAGWFGREANLRYLPWEEWKQTVSSEEAQATWDHIAHSPNCSIDKARRLIAYNPRYESLDAVREAVDWLVAHGVIRIQAG
ncbi:UDP-glucose 4-epimerase [Alicyclobacillus cellulosilyticus]|uniref:UDP-glucose 4-epimerase n=1 Tax=Alicyclobacillus cellulosilyticus TaxID=1003997 RepID=A0A917NGT9_9BACL|nr:NAD-dependent epimerase/dehydratase family protein [Alicyclobacillus cellulosilyticus]GGI99973.1 UDP-glucose 4-epimerase [Alicyclobacillus cellulosilyticus]